MPTTSTSKQSLGPYSYAALLAGARAAAPSVQYDQKGYANCWEDNLVDGSPIAEIRADFGAGAGSELNSKLKAAHSSAALAVNSFGAWRIDAGSLCLGGGTGFRSMRFEATFPTGLGGIPPHLDMLAEGDLTVAVESKCTEWMTCKPPVFSSSYDILTDTHGHSSWFEQIHQLRDTPDRYKFLDSAQLVKHALGLMRRYGSREVRLMYLFWEPKNAANWPECRQHRQEIDDLAARVQESTVKLISMSYGEVWTEWEHRGPPRHLGYLSSRYSRVV